MNTNDQPERSAHCGRRAASITLAGEPKLHAVCHSADCKRRTGSVFGILAYFRREAVVERSGATQTYAFRHPVKAADQQRHFCARCGTTLFWFVSDMSALVGVAGGCFADDEAGEPSLSVRRPPPMCWRAA